MLHHFFDESHERKQIEDGYQRNCENVLHATNLIVEETLHEDLEIFLDKRDDLVNSEIVKRYGLRDSVATKMQKLHKQLLEFLDSLRNISLDVHKYERVNTLTERQRIFVIESQKLDETETFYARQHEELQNELARVEAEDQRRINDLKLEMGYFLNLRKNIELQMKADGELTHEKLKVLTTECYGLCKVVSL